MMARGREIVGNIEGWWDGDANTLHSEIMVEELSLEYGSPAEEGGNDGHSLSPQLLPSSPA